MPRKTFDLASATQEEALVVARKMGGMATLDQFFRAEGFDSYIGESGGAYFTSPADEREFVVLDLSIIGEVREPTREEFQSLDIDGS